MNKRLQTILDIEHITAAQLADTLGIQRGGVSHLLSGRNKPSFDFLEKILRKYPEINAEWLITGKGRPIRTKDGPDEPLYENKTLNHVNQITDFQDNIYDYDLFENPIGNNPLKGVAQPTFTETQSPTKTDVKSESVHASPLPDRLLPADKKPVRVIIYFSDGTFSEFYPFSVSSRAK